MHFPNPFSNAPRLPSPTKRRTHSRSPSHSPVRYRARDADPLLRDLSPTSTLRAFVADPNEWTESTSNALARSILNSSHSERALGAKAAQTCLDVRSWTREMEHWQWPGTFEVPEGAKRRPKTLVPGEEDHDEEEYWGSLPAKTVRAYGARADEIGQALDQIDVEELKDFVLSSHYRSGGRPTDRGKRDNLKQLDDYTAVITATILQALPYLSRLNRLLDIWTIRLIVLQGATVFIRDLQRARIDLDCGWAAIAASPTLMTDNAGANFNRKALLKMKDLIEHQVASLGRRLDRFLDDLEGREETVPDSWIEDFELLETTYGDWVVQAERKVLENEWRELRERTTMTKIAESDAILGAERDDPLVSHTEDPESDGEAVVRLSPNRRTDGNQEHYNDSDMLERDLASHPADIVVDETIQNLCTSEFPPLASSPDEQESDHAPISPVLDGHSIEPTTNRALDREILPALDNSSDHPTPGSLHPSRTAFLNSIDYTHTLKKAKSPVQPFEHASNAFTRLFRKDRAAKEAKLGALKAETDKAPSTRNIENVIGQRRKSLSSGFGLGRRTRSAHTESTKRPDSSNPGASFGGADGTNDPSPLARAPSMPILMPPKDIARRRSVMDAHEFDVVSGAELTPPFQTYEELGCPIEWPLSMPESPQMQSQNRTEPQTQQHESEIYTPSIPLETDAFDQMFVQSLPETSSARPNSARESRKPAKWFEEHRRTKSLQRAKRKLSAPKTHLQVEIPAGLASSSRTDPTSPEAVPEFGLQPASLLADASAAVAPESNASPEIENSDQMKSHANRNVQSVPDVDGAAKAEQTSSTLAQMLANSDLRPITTPSPSTESQPETYEPKRPEKEMSSSSKRASITSVQDLEPTGIQDTVTPSTPKNQSHPLTSSPPRTPESSRSASPVADLPNSTASTPATGKVQIAISTPPRGSSLGKAAILVQPQTPSSRRRDDRLSSSPPLNATPNTPEGRSGSLNATMVKRRTKAPDPKYYPVRNVLTLSPSKKGAFFNPEGDSFDRHVSEVLETLPSSIRFKTRSGAETPVSEMGEPRSWPVTRVKNARVPPRHNVTIAPAEGPSRKSHSGTDNEVKVYHLTQAGSDETIKLFVRLVGESERVMVRVGGGWADLADYLRQYAEHHGSRTVSQGTLEFQPVNGTASRRVSGAAEQKGKQPVTPVADRTPDRDGQPWLDQPQPRFSMGETTSSDEEDRTENRRPPPPVNTTPLSTNGSRPSTANTERPHSRQSMADVKLSGPSSGKRTQLSEHKEKWVEGMIERAKQASAEKSKEDGPKYFAELGKAGATRRVIFRSSSAMSNRPNGNGNEKSKA